MASRPGASICATRSSTPRRGARRVLGEIRRFVCGVTGDSRIMSAPPNMRIEIVENDNRYTMTLCEINLRPGGRYRFVHRGPDGNEYPFKGVYRQIVPPERLVYTQIFDVPGMSGHELLAVSYTH